MAEARQVVPGTTYFLTRRCSERRYFLRPDGFVTRAFLFILALALKRYGVRLLAACVMGNHWHAVLYDPEGKLPRFAAMVHRLVAKCINCFRGRWEAMWSSERYSAIALHTVDDIIDKVVYTLANPVRAGLVAKADDWPGLLIGPHNTLAATYEAAKPDRFFRKKSRRIPMSACLRPVKEGLIAELSDEDYVGRVADRLAERQREVARELAAEGRDVMGADAVLEVDPNSAPTSWEPKRNLNPRIVARDTALRVRLIALRQAFLEAYAGSRDRWRKGRRQTTFPAGTYWMKQFHGVRAAEPTPVELLT